MVLALYNLGIYIPCFSLLLGSHCLCSLYYNHTVLYYLIQELLTISTFLFLPLISLHPKITLSMRLSCQIIPHYSLEEVLFGTHL